MFTSHLPTPSAVYVVMEKLNESIDVDGRQL
mgnify:FL=1